MLTSRGEAATCGLDLSLTGTFSDNFEMFTQRHCHARFRHFGMTMMRVPEGCGLDDISKQNGSHELLIPRCHRSTDILGQGHDLVGARYVTTLCLLNNYYLRLLHCNPKMLELLPRTS